MKEGVNDLPGGVAVGTGQNYAVHLSLSSKKFENSNTIFKEQLFSRNSFQWLL